MEKSHKIFHVFAIAFLCVLCYGAGYYTGLRHNAEDTTGDDVRGTIQQLTDTGSRVEEQVDTAGQRIENAQKTTDRIEASHNESGTILDRLQTELDDIARANGLTD